jgi:hypothetical protein
MLRAAMKAVKSSSAPRLARVPGLAIAPPRAGQIVGERYQLEEWLESGAMGSVWRARQVRLHSPAAVKFLDPSLIELPEMLERFLQEARSAAAVQSAHVIQVFDYGSTGGLPYIAMEFLEGENLEARLARCGLLSPSELDKIFSELARGLGQAHELGVIHRDVKPGNIFLAREGRHEVTKLIDFGIAKVKADALRVSQIVGTELGTLLGTPQYMSPEQLRGRSTVDYRTDLWSLAIIACECLTGRHPFAGATIGDLTVQICTEEPPAPSALGDVPAGFDHWFFKGTRKEPSERFESAADMADALTKILVPRERAAASVRRLPQRVLPSVRALGQAFSAGAALVLGALAAGFERARALGSSAALTLRAKAGELRRSLAASPLAAPSLAAPSFAARSTVTQSLLQAVRRLGAWRLGSLPVAAGLALVVSCALVLGWGLRRGSASPTLPAEMATAAISGRGLSRGATLHETQAVLPSTPLPGVSATSAASGSDRASRALPPVLTPDDLPLVPATPARSAPVKTREAQPRGKRPSPGRGPDEHNATSSSPMSDAMRRLGALMAQGGDPPRPARPKAASSVKTKGRARPRPE